MKLGGFPERIWASRGGRALAPLAIFMLLGTPVAPGAPPPPPGPGEAALIATPVALGGDASGRLRFLAGWTLTSPDARFGGLSGLSVADGGATALSDIGLVIRFRLPAGGSEARVSFRPLMDGPGPGRGRRTRDTEALLVAGDRLWVAYERQNMVWRYVLPGLRAESAAGPPAMRRWFSNSGPETLVRLADGRFLVIAEGREDGERYSETLLFAGDPSVPGTPATRLRYRRPEGFRATDAALLPDGRVLILNRRFAWLRLSAKLVVADPRGLSEGRILEGQEVATLEAPLRVDNMEGVAVTREEGRTIIWLVSDNDFMAFRPTLLLKFELRL